MDGGVADIAHANTRRINTGRAYAAQHNAHNLRTPSSTGAAIAM